MSCSAGGFGAYSGDVRCLTLTDGCAATDGAASDTACPFPVNEPEPQRCRSAMDSAGPVPETALLAGLVAFRGTLHSLGSAAGE